MIPKIIHQIWLGDQSKRPSEMMETWKEKNPTWEYRFWSEENLPELRNQKQFDAMVELAGKADILRYELLYDHGGFFIDADSVCVNSLDDFFIDNKAFCCWENEKIRQGLMSNGYLATEKNSPIVKRIIEHISTYPVDAVRQLPNLTAWRVVGPVLLTETVNSMPDCGMKIYPSHYFIPRHYTGLEYDGDDKIYAEQYWGSTHTINGKMGMQYGD